MVLIGGVRPSVRSFVRPRYPYGAHLDGFPLALVCCDSRFQELSFGSVAVFLFLVGVTHARLSFALKKSSLVAFLSSTHTVYRCWFSEQVSMVVECSF